MFAYGTCTRVLYIVAMWLQVHKWYRVGAIYILGVLGGILYILYTTAYTCSMYSS